MEQQAKHHTQKQSESIKRIEKYNNCIHELQKELKATEKEKENGIIQSSIIEEQTNQIKELSEYNNFLEEQITRLCELPLLHQQSPNVKKNSVERHGIIVNYEKILNQRERELEKNQASIQKKNLALSCLQQDLDNMHKDRDKLMERLEISGLPKCQENKSIITDLSCNFVTNEEEVTIMDVKKLIQALKAIQQGKKKEIKMALDGVILSCQEDSPFLSEFKNIVVDVYSNHENTVMKLKESDERINKEQDMFERRLQMFMHELSHILKAILSQDKNLVVHFTDEDSNNQCFEDCKMSLKYFHKNYSSAIMSLEKKQRKNDYIMIEIVQMLKAIRRSDKDVSFETIEMISDKNFDYQSICMMCKEMLKDIHQSQLQMALQLEETQKKNNDMKKQHNEVKEVIKLKLDELNSIPHQLLNRIDDIKLKVDDIQRKEMVMREKIQNQHENTFLPSITSMNDDEKYEPIDFNGKLGLELSILKPEISKKKNTSYNINNTFIVVDFLHFESRIGPIVEYKRNKSTNYNFSTVYKIENISTYLITSHNNYCTFELYSYMDGEEAYDDDDAELLARGSINVSEIVEMKNQILSNEVCLFTVRNGDIFGHLEVKVCLSLNQQTNIIPAKYVTSRIKLNFQQQRAAALLFNQINIEIHEFQERSNLSSSIFVHYQLLGFPDTFTNHPLQTNVSERQQKTSFFYHSEKYNVVTDMNLIKILRNRMIIFSIISKKRSIPSKEDVPLIIGVAKTNLNKLVNYGDILVATAERQNEKLDVINAQKETIGTLTVSMHWLHELVYPKAINEKNQAPA